jgi:hypothetical protein
VGGADRLPNSGYLRAKVAQENRIKSSNIPYTILRSTQFFEFVERVLNEGTDGDVVQLSRALVQPIEDHVRRPARQAADFRLFPVPAGCRQHKQRRAGCFAAWVVGVVSLLTVRRLCPSGVTLRLSFLWL